MKFFSKKLASYVIAAVFATTSLALPAVASAGGYDYIADSDEPTGGTMMADAFLMRPFMLVGTAVTTATFVVMLPFSILGGNVSQSADTLVTRPAKYTFVRPLGKL
jgi:hypothetical protein